MYFAELGDFQRQVTIGFETILENLDVARAVHRFDGICSRVIVAMLRQEYHVAIFFHVTGSDPERGVHELR